MVRRSGDPEADHGRAVSGRRRLSAATLLCCALPMLAVPASAFWTSDDEPEAEAVDGSLRSIYFEAPGPVRDWTVQFEPSVWYAVPGGSIDLPGLRASGGDLSLIDLDMDRTGLRPAGELQFRRGRWMGLVGGIYLEEESDTTLNRGAVVNGTGFDAGDRVESRLRFATARLLGGYRIHSYQGGPTAEGGHNFTSDIDFIAGARFTSVNWRMAAEDPGVTRESVDQSRLFPEAVGGVRWTMGFVEEFSIDAEATVGGMTTGDDDSAFSLDIILGFAWDPHPNMGAQFGYRQLLVRFSDGEDEDRFRYDGEIAGLYAGVKVRF